mgnify:CR=1 FL=1
MTPLSVNFVASCKNFNSGNPDKNGKDPILLKPIGGKSPRGINVLSGTSAELQDFIPGKCYAVQATETAPYETEDGRTVRSFNFDNLGELSPIEAMEYSTKDTLKFLIQPENAQVEAGEVEEVN